MRMNTKKLDKLRMQIKQALKGVGLDAIMPIPLIALVNLIACNNFECWVITFLVLPIVVFTYYLHCAKTCARTNFFLVFGFASGLYLLGLFEFFVPLLELLPEENFIFVCFIFIAVFCFYKTYHRSLMNRLGQTQPAKQEDQVTLLIAEEKAVESDNESEADGRIKCPSCSKFIPPRTFHCNVCKCCVLGRDHHNFFLNCCVGRFNHAFFFAGCVSCFCALVLFVNLTITSICHPFPLFMVFGVNVLLPDNCDGVFTEYEYALCAVGATFAGELAIMLLFVIIQQVFLISKGVTSTEYHLKNERRSRNGLCWNWKIFCKSGRY